MGAEEKRRLDGAGQILVRRVLFALVSVAELTRAGLKTSIENLTNTTYSDKANAHGSVMQLSFVISETTHFAEPRCYITLWKLWKQNMHAPEILTGILSDTSPSHTVFNDEH